MFNKTLCMFTIQPMDPFHCRKMKKKNVVSVNQNMNINWYFENNLFKVFIKKIQKKRIIDSEWKSLKIIDSINFWIYQIELYKIPLRTYYIGLPHKRWDLRDDCTELILSVLLYSWFTANCRLVFFLCQLVKLALKVLYIWDCHI